MAFWNRNKVNKDLLRTTLAKVEANQEFWYQGMWFKREESDAENEVCKTSFCFAGWAALEAGAPPPPPDAEDWGITPDGRSVNYVGHSRAFCWDGEDCGCRTQPEGTVHVSRYAQQALNLTQDQRGMLFSGNNSLEEVQYTVGAYIKGTHIDKIQQQLFERRHQRMRLRHEQERAAFAATDEEEVVQ